MAADSVAPASLSVPITRIRPLNGLNPIVGVVEGFRWALLGTKAAPSAVAAVSELAALVLLVSGALFFRRMEATFADVV